jgi:hypothetical protein
MVVSTHKPQATTIALVAGLLEATSVLQINLKVCFLSDSTVQ